MSGKIVNLNQARKRKARIEKTAEADANAAKHGRSKVDRSLSEARAEKDKRDHEGHKRD